MNTYKVFSHPTKEVKAVKTGFALLAIPFVTLLPFLPIWFLFRGLWKIFIAYILTILILASIDYEIYGELGFFNFSNSLDEANQLSNVVSQSLHASLYLIIILN